MQNKIITENVIIKRISILKENHEWLQSSEFDCPYTLNLLINYLNWLESEKQKPVDQRATIKIYLDWDRRLQEAMDEEIVFYLPFWQRCTIFIVSRLVYLKCKFKRLLLRQNSQR